MLFYDIRSSGLLSYWSTLSHLWLSTHFECK